MGNVTRITVRVIPRSSQNTLVWETGETEEGESGTQHTLKARLTAPPVDGAANSALIKLLADRLGLPRRAILIVRGETARQKLVEIAGMTLSEIRQKLEHV
jgi:uncharacterized protein (TIGR00251 family)